MMAMSPIKARLKPFEKNFVVFITNAFLLTLWAGLVAGYVGARAARIMLLPRIGSMRGGNAAISGRLKKRK